MATEAMRSSSDLLAEGLAAAAMDDTWALEHKDAIGMSEFGRCPRRSRLRLHEIKPTNVPPVDAYYTAYMGQVKHRELACLMAVPKKAREVKIEWECAGMKIIGHADAILDGWVREWKTSSQGGVAFPRIADEIQVTALMVASGLPAELFYKCDNGNEGLFKYEEPIEEHVQHIEWFCQRVRRAQQPKDVPCSTQYCESCHWCDLCAEIAPTPDDLRQRSDLDFDDLLPDEQAIIRHLVAVDANYKRAEALREELKGKAAGILDDREIRGVVVDGCRVFRAGSQRKSVDIGRVKEIMGAETPIRESVSTWVEVRAVKGAKGDGD